MGSFGFSCGAGEGQGLLITQQSHARRCTRNRTETYPLRENGSDEADEEDIEEECENDAEDDLDVATEDDMREWEPLDDGLAGKLGALGEDVLLWLDACLCVLGEPPECASFERLGFFDSDTKLMVCFARARPPPFGVTPVGFAEGG